MGNFDSDFAVFEGSTKHLEMSLDKYNTKQTPLKYQAVQRNPRLAEISGNTGSRQNRSLEAYNRGQITPPKEPDFNLPAQFPIEMRVQNKTSMVHKLQPITLENKNSGS